MKYLLLTTVEAVMLVGWGNPEANHAQLDATKEGINSFLRCTKIGL